MAKSSTFVATLKFIDSFTPGFSKAIREAERQTKTFQNQMRSLGNLGSSIKNVGLGLTAGLTVPIVGLGTKAVQSAMSYEGSINKIMTLQRKFASQGSIDLSNPESIRKFEETTKSTITNLSNTYGVAQTDLAQSYYLLASAFNETTHMQQAMTTATQMSIAGNVDSASSARLLATLYNAYGKTLGETDETIEKIGDVMAATVNFGFTEFPELASVLGQVAPQAAQMGISIEDLATSMAVITSTGISTAKAVTYFKNAINKATTNGDRKLFTEDNFLSYLESVRDTMPEYEQVVEKFKNIRATSGMVALSGQTDLFKAYHDEMKNANGTLSEMFKNMSSNSSHNFQVTITRLSNILEKFGERILPTVNKYLEKFTTWLDGIELTDKDIDNMIGWAKALALVGPALVAIGSGAQLIASVGSAVSVIKGIVTAINGLNAANATALGGALSSGTSGALTAGATTATTVASTAEVGTVVGTSATGLMAGLASFGVGLGIANQKWNEFKKKNPEAAAEYEATYKDVQAMGITSNSTAQEVLQAYRASKASREMDIYGNKIGKETKSNESDELALQKKHFMELHGNASGTSRWKGGLTTINERGGEIVDLPTGSRIYPHDQSMKMGGLTINIPKFADTITIRNENDIDMFAEAFANKLLKVVVNR